MDANFTQQLKEWLDTPPECRDLAAGNLLLLRLSGNRVGYNMIARNPSGFASFLHERLSKFYDFRVRKIQHEDVVDMQKKVDRIVREDLSKSLRADIGPKSGRRPDHDALPQDIRDHYESNLEIIVEMRKIHKKLRELSLDDAVCPDSERFPFLKQLISLDKRLHENWRKYDSFKAEEQ